MVACSEWIPRQRSADRELFGASLDPRHASTYRFCKGTCEIQAVHQNSNNSFLTCCFWVKQYYHVRITEFSPIDPCNEMLSFHSQTIKAASRQLSTRQTHLWNGNIASIHYNSWPCVLVRIWSLRVPGPATFRQFWSSPGCGEKASTFPDQFGRT